MSTVDPRALTAFNGPGRVELVPWWCKTCGERLATLWSTPSGKILTWSSPHDKPTTVERRHLIDHGVPGTLDGFYVWMQFVDDDKLPSTLQTVCSEHGPREITTLRADAIAKLRRR